MKSLTKNYVQEDVLISMCKRAFPAQSVIQIKELTEGFFNVAYLIELSGKKETVLKIGPKPEAKIQIYEKNIMYSEVKSMELAAKLKSELPVARILSYDASMELCQSEYFFMEKMEGKSFHTEREQMSKEEIEAINYELGKLNRELNEITGVRFGLFGQEEYQGKNWYDVFFEMLNLALRDREKLNIDLINEDVKIKNMMLFNKVKLRKIFEEVHVPRLVHFDLWEGNVFVKNKKISGMIDFERCIFADELMELGFRNHYRIPAFLEGYGKTTFTPFEEIRSMWYDVYLYLLMSVEVDYREYDDRGMFDWPFRMLKESVSRLEKELAK